MRALEPWHFLILALVVVLLFGGKRLPDAARGLGRSLRIFKSEVKQMQDESPRPTNRSAEPLEGRVVEEHRVVEEQRATTPGETPRRDV